MVSDAPNPRCVWVPCEVGPRRGGCDQLRVLRAGLRAQPVVPACPGTDGASSGPGVRAAHCGFANCEPRGGTAEQLAGPSPDARGGSGPCGGRVSGAPPDRRLHPAHSPHASLPGERDRHSHGDPRHDDGGAGQRSRWACRDRIGRRQLVPADRRSAGCRPLRLADQVPMQTSWSASGRSLCWRRRRCSPPARPPSCSSRPNHAESEIEVSELGAFRMPSCRRLAMRSCP